MNHDDHDDDGGPLTDSPSADENLTPWEGKSICLLHFQYVVFDILFLEFFLFLLKAFKLQQRQIKLQNPKHVVSEICIMM